MQMLEVPKPIHNRLINKILLFSYDIIGLNGIK
jgi:hypothetical protein